MRRHTGQLSGHAQTHGAARWTCADTRGSSVDSLIRRAFVAFAPTVCLHTLSICLHTLSVCITPSVCTLSACLHPLSVCLALSVCLHTVSVCTHWDCKKKKKKRKKEEARGVRKTCLAVSQPYGDHAPSRFTGPPALPTAGCKAFVVVVLRGNPSGHYRGQSVSADLG